MADSDDPITNAICSGSTYEQLRVTEGSMFSIPAPKAMAIQAALLGVLALAAPLYLLFPDSVAAVLPTTDPTAATPKWLILGVFGWGTELLAAVMLVGLYYYRTVRAPLSKSQARTVFDVERIAAGLSLVTGGLAIVVTVVLVGLGVGGESLISAYLESVSGDNIYAQMDIGLSVAHLSVMSAFGALAVLVMRQALAGSY